MSRIHEQIEALVAFAYRKKLIDVEDLPYARNLLIDALGLDAPADVDAYAPPGRDVPGTATAILDALCDYAAEAGIIPPEPPVRRELFAARLMGLLTPPPSALAERFIALEQARGAREATAWFYRLCRDNNYIRVDDIARNVVFESPSPAGDLIVTINLSKPEKDPKTIALEKSLPASGYPKCMLCVENTGYAGRFNFPARQNHRMLPLMLGGQRWHFQYSPYLYYNEHCIVLNDRHVPMKMGPHTFEAMFDFVDRFEHYFIGSNADLPIVGGSILSHDHYQGGRQAFPMTKAPIAAALAAPRGVRAGILNWPLSSVRLISADRGLLTGLAGRVLEAWREWSDGEFGILAHSKGPDGATSPHNAVTPLLRREGENYVLDLVLRNNRTDGLSLTN